MKIVILEKEECLGIGGIVVHNQRLSTYLKGQGNDVTIIRFTNSKNRQNGMVKIPYHVAEKRTFIIVPSEKTKQLLIKHLTRLKPDIVHFCLGISPFDYFIPSLCHELKIPVVGIWHGDFNNGSDAYSLLVKSIYLAYSPICRELDGLVVFSQKLKDFYVQRGSNARKISIIPNGVDTKFYTSGRSQFKMKHKIKTGVLFLGRLTTVKHPDLLIESFLRLNTNENAKLIMAGSGDTAEELKERFTDPRVIFTGLITNDNKKRDIIRACDVFVLPSSYEGMSLALLEAMSCGLACIATDAGNSPEVLKNSGFLINHQKIRQELPVALRILLEQKEIRKFLGTLARRFVVKFHKESKIFASYLSLYQRTISNYKELGSGKINSDSIDLVITNKLKSLWQKAKKIGATYFLGEINHW